MGRRTQTSIRLTPGRIQVRGPLAGLIMDGLMDQGRTEAQKQASRNHALQNQPGATKEVHGAFTGRVPAKRVAFVPAALLPTAQDLMTAKPSAAKPKKQPHVRDVYPSPTHWTCLAPKVAGYYWAKLGPQEKALGVIRISGAEVRFHYNGISVLASNQRFLAWAGPIPEPIEP